MSAPLIYADFAAATPVDKQVLMAMQPYFADTFYNPSALYGESAKVHKDIETARASVAAVLGARPSEIIFTAGATEANNLVIRGVMAQHPRASLIVSAVEHDSVLVPAHEFDAQIAPVKPNGIIDVTALESIVQDNTVLVSLMYANNEVGTIQPLKAVSSLLAKVRADRKKNGNSLPLYFHTDAAQAANYLDLHVSRLGVDFLTLNGGKIYGPKQSGALYVSAKARLVPQITGGKQEFNMRSGTENVAGIIGVAKALAIASSMRESEAARLRELREMFIQRVISLPIDVTVNGSQRNRLPNNVHITLTGFDNERILIGLDTLGVMAAAGSACSASSDEPSHVLKAMGITDDAARSSLRFTFGRTTTKKHIEQIVAALAKVVADER